MAPSSSSIPAAFTQLDGAEALGDGDVPHPLAYLAAIRDPRAQWAAASADCDPGHGRRGSADRRSFLRRDRRVGRGCPTAGAGGAGAEALPGLEQAGFGGFA